MIYLLLFAVLFTYVTGLIQAHREAKERKAMARLWMEIEKARNDAFWSVLRAGHYPEDIGKIGDTIILTPEQRLEIAVLMEDYETAARIRDEIKETSRGEPKAKYI